MTVTLLSGKYNGFSNSKLCVDDGMFVAGKWTAILNNFKFMAHRTTVNLKDAYRYLHSWTCNFMYALWLHSS